MALLKLEGIIQSGKNHFSRRMQTYSTQFANATGQELYPGTLNVKIQRSLCIREHFRIKGATIDEPGQDLLFEICRINCKWAYRIRPLNLKRGTGGHGDSVLEIACTDRIKENGLSDGDIVVIEFFR